MVFGEFTVCVIWIFYSDRYLVKTNLGANHLTSEGGLGDFEKNILQVHMRKKKFLHEAIAQKKFMHVQWAGKKILARCFLG